MQFGVVYLLKVAVIVLSLLVIASTNVLVLVPVSRLVGRYTWPFLLFLLVSTSICSSPILSVLSVLIPRTVLDNSFHGIARIPGSPV